MPTQRPRLTITLTAEVQRTLKTFSKLTGQSQGSFVLELLTQTVPHLEKVAVALQQAQKLTGDARKASAQRFSAIADTMTRQAAEVARNGDMFLDLSADTDRAVMDQGGKGQPANQPPPVNKGVRNSQEGTKGASKVVRLRSRL